MILVDANLLLYAKAEDFPQHEAARSWLDARLNGVVGVGLAWPSLLAFVRLIANPRIFARPLSVGDGWAQVRAWRSRSVVFTPEPTSRHGEILDGWVHDSVSRSNLVPDAHLAALAVEYGLTLCSTDGDFARFQGLRWMNPLRPS
ncbi:MAG: type II toxin-antitoxin system VapC family toxin [Gemmatimonadetes bacterium]|nr:type II toxin-antitoxin system VapC family toxin [Gemmatimonadota bacterium]